MKRILCIDVALTILVLSFGCSNQKTEKPVKFYYIRADYTIGAEDSVISPETRDASAYVSDQILLTQYLRGPKGNILVSPFPAGTALLDVDQTAHRFIVTLTDSFASLTGIDLTLACTALAMTCFQLTDLEEIEIKAETTLLDGDSSIIINRASLSLVDEYSDATTATNS